MALSRICSVGKVAKPYPLELALGFLATQAGTVVGQALPERRAERSPPVTNSHRLPIHTVVPHMESGRGTISYRFPPAWNWRGSGSV